jgi:hypothetical protein
MMSLGIIQALSADAAKAAKRTKIVPLVLAEVETATSALLQTQSSGRSSMKKPPVVERTVRFEMRLSEQEHEDLVWVAEKGCRTPPSLLRYWITQSAKTMRGFKRRRKPTQGDKE